MFVMLYSLFQSSKITTHKNIRKSKGSSRKIHFVRFYIPFIDENLV
jgi:hypothetical protein